MQSSSKNRWWNFLWLSSELPLIIFIFFNLGFSSLTGYLTPFFIKRFYDSLNEKEVFWNNFYLLTALLIAEYLNRAFFQLATHRYIQILLTEVRKKSFSLWLKAPFKKKGNKVKNDDYPMGEVLARLMNDTDSVREIVSSGSFAIFIDIIFIVSCLISFLQLNSTTGFALFIAEMFACYLLVKGSKVMSNLFMEIRRVTGLMSRVVTDITSGLKELFFSPNDRYASRRGEKIFEEFLTKQLRANVWDAGYYSAAESLYPILVALLMIIVPYSKIIEVAILAALIDLIQRSISPIKDVASKISVLARARTGIERLQQFNDSFHDEKFNRKDYVGLNVDSFNFSLQSFQYDQGFTLSGMNFKLKRGEVLGILGESGCGKSTLLKLLSGQYQTFQGFIKVDNQQVNTEVESELRDFSSFVSLISQDSHVFTESMKFNITLGVDQGFEAFWELAKSSIPYLSRWGLTSESIIRPKLLSMGQKQLISGLRALFLKKPIILMDEISSGLDSDLEAALRDLIKLFQSQSITIIVTHRLETILNSDKLLLLDKGNLVVQGSPLELKDHSKYLEFLSHLTQV